MRLLEGFGSFAERVLAPLVTGTLLLGSAVVLVAVYAGPACACNPKYKAYLTAMKSDLRNMVTAQEAHRAAHGAYASELSPDEYRTSTGVTVLQTRVTRNGFAAAVAYPSKTERRCQIVHSPGRPFTPVCND